MRKEREDRFDPARPALVVTYGNTTRKHRPLDRDLVVLGRSSCCDVGLVSPEVAPIHCVIFRVSESWRIRDCTGRSGTRLNGKAVLDEELRDGDALQIGTFSFQLHLPDAPRPGTSPPVAPSRPAADADAARLRRLEKSRERLARRAWGLRRELRERGGPPRAPSAAGKGADGAEPAGREEKLRAWQDELAEQDRALRGEYDALERQRRELEQYAQQALARRQAELEKAAAAALAGQEKQLDEVRAEVARERAALRLEHDELARARFDTELELEELIRAAVAQVEAPGQRAAAAEAASGPDAAPAADLAETARRLDIRAGELGHYALYLHRTRDVLLQYEQELAEAYQQFQAAYANASRERPPVASAQESADAIRAEMRQEFDKVREELLAEAGEERARAERAENLLIAMKQELTTLRNEARRREEIVEHLRGELRERDGQLAELRTPQALDDAAAADAPEKLARLVANLRAEIRSRDLRIQELQRRTENLAVRADPREQEAYEAELNRYRAEMERDREALNEQVARLRQFEAELEQLRQETELQLSRERALIAQEWAEINRVRDKLRQDVAAFKQGVPPGESPSDSKPATPAPQTGSEKPTPPDPIARLGRINRTTGVRRR